MLLEVIDEPPLPPAIKVELLPELVSEYNEFQLLPLEIPVFSIVDDGI